jgi:hypothetical protein
LVVLRGAVGRRAFVRHGVTVPVRLVAGGRIIGRTIAQVDTGSTIGSVDSRLVRVDRALVAGLAPVGTTLVSGVNGTMALPLYPVALHTEQGYELTAGPVLADVLPPPQQALIGRESLARVRFVLDGPTGAWVATAPGAATPPALGWTVPAALAGALGTIALVAGYGRA